MISLRDVRSEVVGQSPDSELMASAVLSDDLAVCCDFRCTPRGS